MSYKFPYFEDRPHVPVAIEYKGERVRFIPLLDSGADHSVLSRSDAMRIGLDWTKGKTILLSNADDSNFRAKQFSLNVDIEGHKFRAKFCFADNKIASMPLLGRKDVFKEFKITIDERSKEVTLKSHSYEKK
ncbi:retropepsin-like domain-containing protein [Patescibacteria group bacterium]|nr:retropepsin-like domain-containing protein [Patescibacteria group bacterium]